MSEQFRLSGYTEYEVVTKNAEGEAEIHKLKASRYLPGVEVEFLTQAPPINIRPSKAKSVNRDYNIIASIPDTQIGYRRVGEELIPTHDERALKVARLIMKEYKPELIVYAGDNLDLPELSTFDRESPQFRGVLQASIDRVSNMYAQDRADHPTAEIVDLDSNHVNRLSKFVLKNAAQLMGIKRANSPEERAVLSYPFLTRMDDLDIKWVGGYPAAEYVYKDDLVFTHGREVRSNGSSADLYSKKYPESNVVFGHVHRQEMQTRTSRAGKYLTAITFGTLARIDGAVPSYHGGTADNGQPVKRYENQQQGMGLIYDYGDGHYQFDSIRIEDGKAFYRGKLYEAVDE